MLRFVQTMLYAILKYWVNHCELHDCEPINLNEHANLLVVLLTSLMALAHQQRHSNRFPPVSSAGAVEDKGIESTHGEF